MKNLSKARREGFVIQKSENELLIYDLKNNKALCLNKTISFVLKNCDGKSSNSQIAGRMSGQFKSAVTDEFVWLTIDQLNNEGRLENPDEIETGFEGVARREVFKKVGFDSLVALPIISSLLAPDAASAQSACVGPGLQTGVLALLTNCTFPGAPCDCFNGRLRFAVPVLRQLTTVYRLSRPSKGASVRVLRHRRQGQRQHHDQFVDREAAFN